MADLSDAFIALPGGLGTLDELAEILTWKQLNLVNKPIGILNVDSFFNPLIQQMQLMVNKGFVAPINFAEIKIADNPKELFALLHVKSS